MGSGAEAAGPPSALARRRLAGLQAREVQNMIISTIIEGSRFQEVKPAVACVS